jgi:hypothetical protein
MMQVTYPTTLLALSSWGRSLASSHYKHTRLKQLTYVNEVLPYITGSLQIYQIERFVCFEPASARPLSRTWTLVVTVA